MIAKELNNDCTTSDDVKIRKHPNLKSNVIASSLSMSLSMNIHKDSADRGCSNALFQRVVRHTDAESKNGTDRNEHEPQCRHNASSAAFAS